jgi:hypothetical protein
MCWERSISIFNAAPRGLETDPETDISRAQTKEATDGSVAAIPNAATGNSGSGSGSAGVGQHDLVLLRVLLVALDELEPELVVMILAAVYAPTHTSWMWRLRNDGMIWSDNSPAVLKPMLWRSLTSTKCKAKNCR